MRRSVLLVLFALAAIAPSTAMASEWYRCRTTGIAQQVCCCPKAQAEEDGLSDEQAVAQSRCCCDVEIVRATASEPRMLGAAVSPPLVLAAHEVLAFPPRFAAIERDPMHVRSRSHGPPLLYLQLCSLLI